jgi:hypothetical protein
MLRHQAATFAFLLWSIFLCSIKSNSLGNDMLHSLQMHSGLTLQEIGQRNL